MYVLFKGLQRVFYCGLKRDFLLLEVVKAMISYIIIFQSIESYDHMTNKLLLRILQKEKIAPNIALKIAVINMH